MYTYIFLLIYVYIHVYELIYIYVYKLVHDLKLEMKGYPEISNIKFKFSACMAIFNCSVTVSFIFLKAEKYPLLHVHAYCFIPYAWRLRMMFASKPKYYTACVNSMYIIIAEKASTSGKVEK